jgi:predicted PurR-regulated permease PerM
MSDSSTLDKRRVVFLALSAGTAALVVVMANEVMLPFVLALLIAYVLMPLVTSVERHHVPRALSIVIVYVVVLGVFGGFVRGVAPRVATEVRNLRDEVPALTDQAKTQWVPAITQQLRGLGLVPPAPTSQDDSPETIAPLSALVARPQKDGSLAVDLGVGVDITPTKDGWRVETARHDKHAFDINRVVADAVGKTFAYAKDNTLELAIAVRDLIAGISRVIFVFFITLMLAAYMMLTHERIVAFFRSLVQMRHRAGFDRLLRRLDEGLSGVVRGQIIICGINGILSAIGFAIVGLKYWPVMALVAGIFSLVPIFGSIASAVPAVAVGLTQGIGTSAFVLVWIVGIHQLEANILNPKIMGDSTRIHPVLVIFALLCGEHFFHAVGALLAVPTLSIVQSLFLHVRAAFDEPEAGDVAQP